MKRKNLSTAFLLISLFLTTLINSSQEHLSNDKTKEGLI